MLGQAAEETGACWAAWHMHMREAQAGSGSGSGGGGGSGRERLASAMARAAVLRAVLQHHLDTSQSYDAGIVMQALQALSGGGASGGGIDAHGAGAAVQGRAGLGMLLREQVLLHRRLGQHAAALRVMGLALHDIQGAILYCSTACGLPAAAGGEPGPGGEAAAQAAAEAGPWMTLLDILLRQVHAARMPRRMLYVRPFVHA